jgi:hypothetical protein
VRGRSFTPTTLKPLFVIAGVSVASSCGPTPPRPAAQIRPQYDKATGRLQRLEYDRDGDGRIDTWAHMDGGRVVRIDVDENGDGRVDRSEYYAARDGVQQLVKIERATKRDGRISRWEYFQGGVLTRVEEDTDGDGRVDTWQTYAGGSLVTLAIDTTKRGKPDRRLVYRADGTLSRIDTDSTGSGAFAPVQP